MNKLILMNDYTCAMRTLSQRQDSKSSKITTVISKAPNIFLSIMRENLPQRGNFAICDNASILQFLEIDKL